MEIEFRGKRLRSSEWVHGFYYEERGFSYITVVTDKPGEIPTHLNVPVDPKTVGQYTNLKDKNGKKIFEGDIVEIIGDEGYEFTSVVEYFGESGYPAFDMRTPEDYYFESNTFSEIIMSSSYELEVIGNIHENPELLEVVE